MIAERKRLGLVDRLVGVDPLEHRRREDEGLEGGSRLAVALRGEVEGPVVVVAGRRHRLDVAGVRVDRHDRRARIGRQVEVVPDRGAAGLLELRIDGREDLQPSAPEGRDAVALDQLLLHVVEEVRLAASEVELAGM